MIRCWPAFLIFLILTSTAQAHMTVEGAGEIANGALHPLMTPAHVMILLGLGLLLGQQLPLDLKTPLRVFAPVSAATLLLTLTGRCPTVYQPVMIGLVLLIAIGVALEMKLQRPACRALVAIAAVAIGLDSAVDSGSALTMVKTFVGTWLSVNAVVFYIAICASNSAGRQWARIGIRVLGSWIIAISLLVLAFSLRK